MPIETVDITQLEHELLAVFVRHKLLKNTEIFPVFFELMRKLLK